MVDQIRVEDERGIKDAFRILHLAGEHRALKGKHVHLDGCQG